MVEFGQTIWETKKCKNLIYLKRNKQKLGNLTKFEVLLSNWLSPKSINDDNCTNLDNFGQNGLSREISKFRNSPTLFAIETMERFSLS